MSSYAEKRVAERAATVRAEANTPDALENKVTAKQCAAEARADNKMMRELGLEQRQQAKLGAPR